VNQEPTTPRIDTVTAEALARHAPTADRAVGHDSRSWRMWSTWYQQAVILTAAGVECAPSHVTLSDGLVVERGEAFHDALDLADVVGGEPVLVLLGTPVTEALERLPELPATRIRPVAVRNQVAGIACQQRHLIGYPLTLTDTGEQLAVTLLDLVRGDEHDCTAMLGLTLSDLVGYHRVTASVGLSAEGAYSQLAEGAYPLDIDHLERLCAVDASLLELRDELRALGPWALYLLTENCD
jgi:hypothetical protein